MRNQLLNLVMAGMLVFGAGGAWAQDTAAPADAGTPAVTTPAPAAEPPATIPAPEVNVNVAPPAAPAQPNIDVHVDAPATAPPTTVILDNTKPSSTTTTNISRTETKVIQQPADATFNPWLIFGIGLAVVIVLAFVAMAFSDRKDRTVVTGRGTSVTTVK